MKTSKLTKLLGVIALVALPWRVVQATPVGTVDIVRSGHGANEGTYIYGGGMSGEEMYTGVYMLDKSAGTDGGTQWDNGQIAGFCIEIEEPVPTYITSYDVISVSEAYSSVLGESVGTTKADYLSELWGRYYDESWAGDGPFTGTENAQAAAFAAAVWEIVYEDLPLTSSGWDVGVDGTAGIPGFASLGVDSSLANSWLHSLDGSGPKATLAVFSNNGKQNYLVAVPEPTTVLLLGLGGVLSVMRRKKHGV